MRITLLCPLLFCLVAVSFAQGQHIGQWAGQSNTGELIQFKFRADGTVLLDRSRGGRYHGKTTGAGMMATYRFDYSKKPAWLDLTFTSKSSGTKVYKYLATFLNADSMEVGAPREFTKRPADFSTAGEIWSLKRIASQ
jgi:hypothetical protein